VAFGADDLAVLLISTLVTTIIKVEGDKKDRRAQKDANELAQKGYELNLKTFLAQQEDRVWGYKEKITALEGQKEINEALIKQNTSDMGKIDRWLDNYDNMVAAGEARYDAQEASIQASSQIAANNAYNQVAQYDRWLANYEDMYAQQVQSKQAQTDALVASGKETYENYLNAIGYADAVAGATGRVGAGTSASHVTGMIDRKLVEYVGEDRKLDAHGGLFGSQLTAANMEMQQLKAQLEMQKQNVLGDRKTVLANLDLTLWANSMQLRAVNLDREQWRLQTGWAKDDAIDEWNMLDEANKGHEEANERITKTQEEAQGIINGIEGKPVTAFNAIDPFYWMKRDYGGQ
jgi:hypothetical protein